MNLFKEKIIASKDFFFDNLYHKYQSDYYNEIYSYKEIFIDEKNIKCFIPFTLSRKKSLNHLSFYGEPIQIYSKIDFKEDQISRILKIFFNQIDLENLKFKIFFKYDEKNLNKKDFSKFNPYQAFKKQEIELNRKKGDIFRYFKPNLKNEIRKIKRNKNFFCKIYDSTNYPDRKILEMKKMHFFVSKKKTRSDNSWELNEKFIKENKGFIVEVLYKKKPISFSFFANDLNKSIYFSSVTDRRYFKLAGVNHLTLWKAIIYSKFKNLKKLELGISNYYFNRDFNQINEKDKNIAFFKSRFCGKENFYLMMDEKSII
jgi:hypothetical protein